MDRLRPLLGPIAVGLAWNLLALVSTGLRDQGGAQLLIWLPSGLVVAALLSTPKRRWPLLIGVLFLSQALFVGFYRDMSGLALAYSVSSLVQGSICVAIILRIHGGTYHLPRTTTQIVGQFAAAILGSAVGTSIAYPFFPIQSFPELSWWFLANVLGILTGGPILLYLRELIGHHKLPLHERRGLELTLAIIAVAALSVYALQVQYVPLMPIMVAAMVFVTIRYGQIGTSLFALAVAVGATIVSYGGQSPAPFVEAPIPIARLVLQQWLFLMLATSLPIAAMLLRRDALEETLIGRNEMLRDNLTIFHLAETVAGIGRWRYDLTTGMQDWSEKMLELIGLSPDLAPDPGNLRHLLPHRGEQLFSEIAAHADDHEPYSFNFRVKPPDGGERVLRISVLNEFDDEDERVALFAVAMDVTDQVKREEALDLARGRAVQLAAEAQKLANTDTLTGLPNRRCSLARLETLIRQSEKVSSSLAVVMFDIDHFKLINDTFGHQTGDEVLVRVAELASQEVRSVDLVGRIGGEEFIWLIPGIGLNGGRKLAERLRSAIEFGSDKDGLPQVTTSIGVTAYQPGDDAERIMARADVALYAAKGSGRNRVQMAAA